MLLLSRRTWQTRQLCPPGLVWLPTSCCWNTVRDPQRTYCQSFVMFVHFKSVWGGCATSESDLCTGDGRRTDRGAFIDRHPLAELVYGTKHPSSPPVWQGHKTKYCYGLVKLEADCLSLRQHSLPQDRNVLWLLWYKPAEFWLKYQRNSNLKQIYCAH